MESSILIKMHKRSVTNTTDVFIQWCIRTKTRKFFKKERETTSVCKDVCSSIIFELFPFEKEIRSNFAHPEK